MTEKQKSRLGLLVLFGPGLVVFLVLLALRITGAIHISWGWVLFPLFIGLAILLLGTFAVAITIVLKDIEEQRNLEELARKVDEELKNENK